MKKIGLVFSLLAVLAIMVSVSFSHTNAEAAKVKPVNEIASVSVLDHTFAVEVAPESLEKFSQLYDLINEPPADNSTYKVIANTFEDIGKYATNADIEAKIKNLSERTGINQERLRRVYDAWQAPPGN